MPPTVDPAGPDLGAAEAVADPQPPARTIASRRRTAPWCASRISADLLLTHCGSHRELVSHRDRFNPTGSKDLASTRCWRVTELRAEPGCASYGRDAGGEIKGGRPGGLSTDRRATRLFCILTKVQKSTGNVVALSELVQSGLVVGPGQAPAIPA